MLYKEYDVKSATMVKANTLNSLVKKLKGVNSKKAIKTILEYNSKVNTKIKFDPTKKMEKRLMVLK